MELSDFELVSGIKAGDRSALDSLVRRWYPRICGYAFKMLRNEQDAYDVTQETFVAMMQGLRDYRAGRKFESWLFTIAHNKCMDHLRARKKDAASDGTQDDCPSPEPPLDESVTVSIAVRQAVDRLPDSQRETVILRYFHQFSAGEISRMTRTPLPTVKSRLKSAKKLLSEYLREGFQ